MKKTLQRRVLMTLFGVPDNDVRIYQAAQNFDQFPLYRRVVAGLFGVALGPSFAQESVKPFNDTTLSADSNGVLNRVSSSVGSLEGGARSPSEGRSAVDVDSGSASLQDAHANSAVHEPPLVPQLLEYSDSEASEEHHSYSGAETVRGLRARFELPLYWAAMWRVVGAAALCVALAGGGVWYATAKLPGDNVGDENPYGEVIGLSAPLQDGDCVAATWRGAPFVGEPGLKVVKCLSDRTNGQVMAVFEASSAEAAQSDGATQCDRRTAGTSSRLADVRFYAVVPTADGFGAAGHRVACLLLGAQGQPVYGPLGDHRTLGTLFTDTATMQKGDCLERVSGSSARLVSCNGPHDEQVLDFLRMSPGTTLAEAEEQATKACQKDVPPNAYGFAPDVYTAASWVGESAWYSETHFVVCTVTRRDGGAMTSEEP
ncbi:hypothetical protein [Streptomyces sp. NPDC050982]|uniref:hypothetical protein n=1 Tax=Streptomyces sp. NPDC050982 TaxID=3154746 RepID=UPI0033FDB017